MWSVYSRPSCPHHNIIQGFNTSFRDSVVRILMSLYYNNQKYVTTSETNYFYHEQSLTRHNTDPSQLCTLQYSVVRNVCVD